MHNNQHHFFNNSRYNGVMNALAISSLLFVVSGCDSTMKNNRASAVTDMVIYNQPTINNQALLIEAKALTSTPEGIAEVVKANNQFVIDMTPAVNPVDLNLGDFSYAA